MPRRIACVLAVTMAVSAPGWAQYEAEQHIAPGSILIADEKLGDPNFAESVVLIVQEDPEGGTLGIIINRPTGATLAKVFPDRANATTDPIYEGGPVDETAVQALFRSPSKVAKAVHIAGDVYVTTDRGVIEKAVTERVAASKFRLYAGYAGWAPGQLEMERRKGAWSLENNAVGYAFDKKPESLWLRLNRAAHSQIAGNPDKVEDGQDRMPFVEISRRVWLLIHEFAGEIGVLDSVGFGFLL